MTLEQARTILKLSSHELDADELFTLEQLDYAIASVLDDFALATGATRQANDLAIALNDTTLSLAAVDGLRADRILQLWIPAKGQIERIGITELIQLQVEQPTLTGWPCKVAFTSATTGELFPKAAAAYTAKVVWRPPITAWEAGTDEPETVTFNLPDDYLRTVLMFGAPAFLQHDNPDYGYASATYQKYLAFRAQLMGVGNQASTASTRTMWRG